MADERKVPTSRLGRLAKLARAGASTGVAFVRNRAADASAERVANLLGELRGVATKMGQMASYVDGLIPDEHQAAFESSMARLRAAAPQSTAAQIRSRIESELGVPLERMFAEWSDAPIASASIGQVHEGRLHDGRRVAVKVQHHGIEAAMEADLRNVGLVDTTVRAFGMGRFEVGRLAKEAAERFREELDYSLEAERLERFAALHREHPRVRIPEVVREASTKRVLTTTFVDGVSFEDALEAGDALRRQWAETLWYFVYGSIMLGGLFNADPHPGNYRFFDDGSVGFLDFGCVQEVAEYHQRVVVVAHQAAHRGDFAGFEGPMSRLLRAQPGVHRDEMATYMKLAIKPITDSPFHITRGYAGDVVTQFKTMVAAMTKLSAKEFKAMPPGVLFLNRLQFGFYSVLARLDVDVDYAAVERTFIDRAFDIVRDYEAI